MARIRKTMKISLCKTSQGGLVSTENIRKEYAPCSMALMELKGGLPLPNHTENDYEIEINEPGRLRTGPIYALNGQ